MLKNRRCGQSGERVINERKRRVSSVERETCLLLIASFIAILSGNEVAEEKSSFFRGFPSFPIKVNFKHA